MTPWTIDQLHRFSPPPAPRSSTDTRPDIHRSYMQVLARSWPLLDQAGINTPLRVAHFMSIPGHETGGFTIIREHTTWSLKRMCQLWPHRFKMSDPATVARYTACRGRADLKAEMAYGGWHDLGQRLGNVEKGDGWRFRGASWFQGTGRHWFAEAGDAVGLDLEGSPETVEDPEIALRIAIWYWQRYRLSEFADCNYLRATHNQINRGNPYSKHDPNGWADRQRWFKRAWDTWGDGAIPTMDGLGIGASGPEVADLQRRLRELKYAPGAVDGIYGRETRRAVAAFKADWQDEEGEQLEPGVVVGPATKAALALAEPIDRSEREAITENELAAAGSSEVAAGRYIKQVGTGVAALGVAGGAASDTPSAPEPINPVPAIDSTVGWVPEAQATLQPVLSAIEWGIKHWWWLAIIVAGVWMYAGGWAIIRARLKAARDGINLWR